MHSVGLTVVDNNPVGVLFSNTVRGTGIEGGQLGLRDLSDFAVKLRSGRLVKSGEFCQATRADGVEKTKRSHPINLCSIFGHLERYLEWREDKI